MVSRKQATVKVSSEYPLGQPRRVAAIPLVVIDLMERRGLLIEVKNLAGDGEGGAAFVLSPGSRLARMIREWPREMDELAASLSERGYCISETLVVVHVLKHRGCE